MPIRVNRLLEPLSAPWPPGSLAAECDAYHRLREGIRQYVDQETNGRSFLVAGHRGSGKTYLIHRAIASLIHDDKGKRQPRPVLVPLHGPDLLKDRPKESDALDPAGTDQVLQQMIRGLYRAVCDEFADCYRDLDSQSPDHHERAAQLRLELDRKPRPERLKVFWKTAEALDTGVLAPAYAPKGNGQGYKELVALSTLVHAVEELRDDPADTRRGKSSQVHSADQKASPDPPPGSPFGPVESLFLSNRRFIGPLASSIFGIAVFVAMIGQNMHPVVAMAAGLLTAFVFLILFAAVPDRSQESTLMGDMSLPTLHRTFLILIDRLRSAGLAPVFVVDETDKVDQLPARMDAIMRRLRGAPAHRALFVFAADREYFDYVANRRIRGAYPRESTYFAGTYFPVYSLGEINGFLEGLVVGSKTGTAEQQAQDEADVEVLRLLAKYRSRMHLGEILRFFDGEMTADRVIPSIGISARGVPIEGHRYACFLQIAIEHLLLSDASIIDRLRQDSYFLQSFYDAVYYVPREWEKREPKLDTSIETFSRYLEDRIVSVNSKPRGGEKSRRIQNVDVKFLHQQMGLVVGFLKTPGTLRDAVGDVRYDRIVGAALQGALRVVGEDEYRWRIDEYGRPLDQREALLDDIVVLAELQKLLTDLDETL
ncbi:MAG: hypothetical protein JNK48_04760, partial [Bryobacterales bacterium]|nr:hypothetical protein [Bryobacterales bacterium]